MFGHRRLEIMKRKRFLSVVGGCLLAICLLLPALSYAWHIEGIGKEPSNSDRSLVLDAAGRPHIVYQGSALYYSYFDGAAWRHLTALNNVAASAASITIDGSGKVHISYYDRWNRDLKYVTNATGAWITTTVSSVGGGVGGTSIAIDGNGKAHISYYTTEPYHLIYATNASGAWVKETISSVPGNPSIAVDGSGKVHIAIAAVNSLDYITNAGGGWHSTVIAKNMYSHASLALDSSGKVHISFKWAGTLAYATNASGIWSRKVIIRGLQLSDFSSIALDSSDKVHISYSSRYPNDLHYVTNSSGTWVSATIDNEGASGGTRIINNEVTEWFSGDDEFDESDEYNSKALWIDRTNDLKVFWNTFRWSKWNVYLSDTSGTNMIHDNHIYNGGSGRWVPENPINIFVGYDCADNHFSDNYLDSGVIDIHNHQIAFVNNRVAIATNADLDYWIKVYGDSSQATPFDFISTGWQLNNVIKSGYSAAPSVATITNATSHGEVIQITTAQPHPFWTNQWVYIQGVVGTTEANGRWKITKIDAYKFDLVGSTFTHAYTSGGEAKNEEFNRVIAGAADNGSGAIRITANAHPFRTGQWVYILDVLGTIEANGRWQVTKIDADKFDLVGSTFTSEYSSGGEARKMLPLVQFVEGTAPEVSWTITNATNHNGLIQITTAQPHPFWTNQWVYIQGVGGTTEANGRWQVTKIDADSFDLVGSTFTHTYTSGGEARNAWMGTYANLVKLAKTSSIAQEMTFFNPTTTTTSFSFASPNDSATGTRIDIVDGSSNVAVPPYIKGAGGVLNLGRHHLLHATITGNTTMWEGDSGKIYTVDNESNNIVITLPNNRSKSWYAYFLRLGTGTVTFTPASGAYIRSYLSSSPVQLKGQYAFAGFFVFRNATGTSAEYTIMGQAD